MWQIVRSTANVLTASDCDRLRECAGVGCGWFFLDFSRNRSRRWCDMEDCGNRAKANRHYDRKQKK
ncbi:CGNR zinc finger domain-containing protein [Leptolyngbya sp. FACHB-16]|nr:CGNR zinc finger domain-containing protein [Leptolyngbya sp. FACHB-8]MBD2158129.1 CGNR zinc finger domain-containing protein [Leptolyngbya sp. FACHB-16]